MNYPPSLDPKASLKQNFYRTQAVKSATPATSNATTTAPDPLAKWKNYNVVVTFLSGRSITGKLTSISRFALEVQDGDGVHHVLKHAIEQMHLGSGAVRR